MTANQQYHLCVTTLGCPSELNSHTATLHLPTVTIILISNVFNGGTFCVREVAKRRRKIHVEVFGTVTGQQRK
jgi:hypothetical protein